MKRIDTFSKEAIQTFMETAIRAYINGFSSFRCNILFCEECQLRHCTIGFGEKHTLEEWLKWLMEEQ